MDSWRPDELEAIARRLGIVGETSAPQVRWVEASDGVRLRALDWGGAGPPALLLHGGALTAQTWDYVCVGLRGEFRLIAWDLRGHGDSGWSETYRVERLGADAADVVEALELGPVHAAGMSLGGATAAELAAQRPELVRTLTLVDVAPGVVFEATANMRSFMNSVTGAASLEAVVEAAMRASPKNDPERVRYRMRTLLRRCDDGLLRWKRDLRRPVDYPHLLERVNAIGERLEGFSKPLLMVRGGRSRSMPREAAQAFAARFPQGRFVEVPDAGHNVQEDNPAGLIAALREFWREA